jgi:hypothetical protein
MLNPAPVQTTYNQYITKAQNGMPATTTGWDVDTRLCVDDTGLGIGFGLAVSQSHESDRGANLGTLSGGSFVGITAADSTLPNIVAGFTDTYEDTDNMAVAVRGDWWVIVGDIVAAGNQAYFNSVTGQLGASGIANATAITNGKWMTSSASAGFAVVRLGAPPA